MLERRRSRRANIEPTLGNSLVFAGNSRLQVFFIYLSNKKIWKKNEC